MLKRLQKKWKVSGGRLILIIATFAVGGSLCGYAGRKLLGLMNIEQGVFRVILYIILVTLLWPAAVILVSIVFGQFSFFRNYLKRIFGRMHKKKAAPVPAPLNIAVFASGAGTNTEQIIAALPGHYREGETTAANINIAAVITDNPLAGVLGIAQKNGIPAEVLSLKNKTPDQRTEAYFLALKKYSVDFIVLAGYLKKIPSEIIKAYPGKIINIHPALLPAFGGAGMYGSRVHEAVIAAGEKESGISIHHVDEIYDNGEVIFRATCPVDENDTPETLAKKIHMLEHTHYPKIIAQVLHSQNRR
ncbi:MAG: phosphoribosylglycinamide formyltransferase [Ferruginibacter sp.]